MKRVLRTCTAVFNSGISGVRRLGEQLVSYVPQHRSLRVDTLRGLACILLVAYHVVGDTEMHGLHVQANSIFRWFTDTFVYLRMPLFTFISGYIYGKAVVSPHDFRYFFWGKIRRLLVPLIFVGGAFRIFDFAAHGNPPNFNLLDMLSVPYEHFWYLQALFLIFSLAFLLDIVGILRNSRFITFVLFFYVLFGSGTDLETNLFSINGAIYLFPYFIFGILIRLSEKQPVFFLVFDNNRVHLLFLFAAFFLVHQAGLAHLIPPQFERDSSLGVLYSLVTLLLLFSLRWESFYLSVIGYFSYTIYLFHVFFTAGSRVLLEFLGVHNLALLFLGGILFGLAIPILLEIAVDRISIFRFLLLGRALRTRFRQAESGS